MAANDTRQLAVAVEPTDAPQGITYESDDVNVATVTQNGVVTAIATGSAVITIKSTSNTAITDTVAVTVS